MTNRELLNRIDKNAAYIREYRPLSEEEVRQLDAYYKIGTTYSSNALEGNSLTLSETKVLLEDGITVGGKPLRDCYMQQATGERMIIWSRWPEAEIFSSRRRLSNGCIFCSTAA